MSESGEWSDWIEHDGSGCPVPAGFLVDAMVIGIWSNTGCRAPNMGLHYRKPWKALIDDDGVPWLAGEKGTVEVKKYRVYRPRALLNLIDLVQSIAAPSGQMVQA